MKNRIRSKQELAEMPYWYYKNSSYWQERKALFESLPKEADGILFVGDSQVNGCEWRELLGNDKVRNRGIDGDNTEGVLARLDALTFSKPAKIFLEVGTNDLALKRSLLEILNDYSAILNQIQQASPKTQIYIQSILPRYDDPNRTGGVHNDSIVELNKGLKTLSLREGVTYIDLHPCFVDAEGKMQKKYSMDGVHLNALGYAVWKKQIEALVK